ncbi:hypothetical protein GOBAR_AA04817 [Gossypium barbadense]|uniref:BED-type domain-containing protein n=1 Tax=Gossypium barbadense TaxID=3634 RepID=A0A2P5YJK4_GOSBA|nr:hypothetical protein GOBAR_AA04817 [Gossypium barbadense]
MDDGFNEYENVSNHQKSTISKVWDEMTKLKCENKDELKAQCNHCKSIFSTKSSSRTSHLRRCLNSCLKKINKDITQYTIATQPSLGGGSSIKTYKFDADKCHRVVSTFLVCGKQSFKTVEELRFRYMMSVDSPNFKNISRQTTTMDVLKYYAQERDHVKEDHNGLSPPFFNSFPRNFIRHDEMTSYEPSNMYNFLNQVATGVKQSNYLPHRFYSCKPNTRLPSNNF